MPRIVVAPDKFKGSLGAGEVAEALRTALLVRRGDLQVVTVPVADGGDGTLDAAVAAGYHRIATTATGPTGEPVETAWGRRGDEAVVELADVSGLSRVRGGRRSALTATSRGTGELVAAALDAGCRRIVVGIGGSACTDGGAGMVQALGARLTGPAGLAGPDLAGGGGALDGLVGLDLDQLHPALGDSELVFACDVDNPLTGPHGAAAVYGPQKGASAGDVVVLDHALGHWADVVAAATGADLRAAPGAGAAGGVGFAAVALLGARLRPGIELVLDLAGFDEIVRDADLVLVGEGSLDEQTLHGKAVAGVARAARAAGARVVAVCGRNRLDDNQLSAIGVTAAYALLDVEPDLALCMDDPARLLGRLVDAIVADGHVDG